MNGKATEPKWGFGGPQHVVNSWNRGKETGKCAYAKLRHTKAFIVDTNASDYYISNLWGLELTPVMPFLIWVVPMPWLIWPQKN